MNSVPWTSRERIEHSRRLDKKHFLRTNLGFIVLFPKPIDRKNRERNN